ncbi:hypothetical protein PPL_04728 [Heterostelium album PN500]|uniref:Phospholipid-transporting ATPase n=1 Tax=Heterostelium pallidum (strain ATCC 26659 / Pp 5 / PN500) TaxID=670386 RepID=D3B8D6_HETP5|nr:hypothetical protein PPL_04728 [Heterostelium album PN500]EFA82304.1 hypothetical protein PPL_04728 [Heterostelium album PN500]|eukprot:XP_020434421.1 hypothetical protein PPL_04728 [Heterostelium album PN500]
MAEVNNNIGRYIYINDELENRAFQFPNNRIAVSSYSVPYFLKKFFLHHTFRLGYLYLFLIMILQFIPGLTPIGQFTTLGPLLVVLVITFVFQMFTTFQQQRHLDREVNGKTVTILKGSNFVDCKAYKLKPGDIIRVTNNEVVPADMILLATSDEENISMVEYYESDGETKFSTKNPLEFTSNLKEPRSLAELEAKISCSGTGVKPAQFKGQIHHDRVAEPVGYTNLVLKSSKLSNTKWVYGVVIFTGKDTLVPHGIKSKKTKLGRVERMTNHNFFMLLSLAIILAAISTVIFKIQVDNGAWYLFDFSAAYIGILFLTSLILYSGVICVTLYITIDFVKMFNLMFINNDLDGSRLFPKSAALVDELGQVAYIFSDKTGTLTQNQMIFKKCTIAGQISTMEECVEEMSALESGDSSGQMIFGNGEVQGGGSEPAKKLDDRYTEKLDFFMALLTCHTVSTEQDDSGDRFYKGSSMDELAIIRAAKEAGLTLNRRSSNYVNVTLMGNPHDFQIVEIIGFTSSRRRMSVIVRNPVTKQSILYMKGADEEIFMRLAPRQKHADSTISHLEVFGKEGFRTLCVGQRQLSEDMMFRWVNEYRAARSSNDLGAMQSLEVEMEQSLTLLGATAIEDRLQPGVPETIHTLRSAGIKIWVLTGDKLLTAMNVGSACQLIDEESMEILVLAENTEVECVATLNEFLGVANQRKLEGKKDIALVFSGANLEYLVASQSTKLQFLKLAERCRVAIGFRLSPQQKSFVVDLVKSNTQKVTLAIGDGANDIGMIENAHIGVGIIGQEGIHAARTSDYSISEFRLLERLLLFHGRNSYQRVTSLIMYIINKSVVLAMIQFWFAIYHRYSATTVFDPTTIAMYSFLFTLFPAIALGIFNRSTGSDQISKFPELYQDGQKLEQYNLLSFIINLGWAFYQSVCIFFIPVFMTRLGDIYSNGMTIDYYYQGVLIFTCMVITVNVKVMVETLTYTYLTACALIFSVASYFVWTLMASGFGLHITDFYKYELLAALYQSASFYLIIVLVVVVALTPEIVYKYVNRSYYPKKEDIAQELSKKTK